MTSLYHSSPRSSRKPSAGYTSTISGMASYIDAAAIVTVGVALILYEEALDLAEWQIGLASGLLTFGIAIGALVGGRLGDRFGRRPVFTATMVVIIAGCTALVLAPSFTMVLIGAAAVGLAGGADLPVSLATISEVADDGNRGKLIGFSNVLWAGGVLVSGVLVVAVGGLGQLGGQILFAHIGIVAAIVLIARLRIPESEPWLRARAERAAGLTTIRASRTSVSRLLRSPYAKPFLGLIVFYALTNLAANTVGQFGTFLLVRSAGVDVSTAGLLGLVIAPLNFLSYFWFMRIADGRHRFRYFTVGAVLWVVGLAVPAVFGFSLVTYLIAAGFAAIGMGFAFETIMKVWAQESFPTLLRTTAQGAIIFAARILSAALATVTPALIVTGPTVLYALLTALVAAGLVVAWVVFRSRDSQNVFDTESRISPTASFKTVS